MLNRVIDIEEVNKKQIVTSITEVHKFLRLNKKLIATFLDKEDGRYKLFSCIFTTFHTRNFIVECAVYVAGDNHVYLEELTEAELRRCLKEIGYTFFKVVKNPKKEKTSSSNEEVL